MSHFYISKKFWKPCQTFGRLVLAVWSRADWLVFFKVSRTFLKYENGSKNFYELLRSILTYTELPHIFEKKSNHANGWQKVPNFTFSLIKSKVAQNEKTMHGFSYTFCRNISLSTNLLLLKSEQSLLMQVLHTILEYLLYIAYSECIFLSDGMTNIRYLFWYKF